jgi:hypothetical protein
MLLGILFLDKNWRRRLMYLQAADAALDNLLRFTDGNLSLAGEIAALTCLGQRPVAERAAGCFLAHAQHGFGMAGDNIHVHGKAPGWLRLTQKGTAGNGVQDFISNFIDTDGSEAARKRVSDSYALSCRTSAPFPPFSYFFS